METKPDIQRSHYDVIVAGARVAGASTAMLLARMGLRVLVVDPVARGRDTLSTHALMRAGVLQLHRWGLLDRVRAAGTPPLRSTTFHYRDESIRVDIHEKDGVDALYAPRRTVLDPILQDGAMEAGAEVVHGHAVIGLARDEQGRVRGASVSDAERRVTDVTADLVIGADGIGSRVARLAGAVVDYETSNAATAVYGYWRGIPEDGNHWYYDVGAGVGTIPTNDGETCVFASVARASFDAAGAKGLEELHRTTLESVSAELAATVAAAQPSSGLRAFPGKPGYLRRSAGPGWALVGDAGYFRDPITAHGMTDALSDAEYLARAVAEGGDEALEGYQARRNERVRGLLDISDRIAAFDWDLEEVKDLHLRLSREMKAEVEGLLEMDRTPVAGVEA